MIKKGKLELTWVGKYEERALEPRILMEEREKSYGDPDTGNMLIHGDNLLTLRALEQEFTGKVKCIYIDPPYNTGAAFEHYDDNLEHSQWLNLMRPRLELLWTLLANDGSIWISIDNDEEHYLKILCDEIFGRKNFMTSCTWQQRTTRENRKAFSEDCERILIYCVHPEKFTETRNTLALSKAVKLRYKNPDNDPRGPWQSVSVNAQGGHGTASQFYDFVAPSGKIHKLPAGRCWLYTWPVMQQMITDNRIWFGTSGQNAPREKKFLSEAKVGLTPNTLWLADDVGTNDAAKKEIIALFGDNVFDTPKPERLIQRIIHIASNPGDLVLDSFLGSGTTAAVAQKMGRRWIGIELGDQAYTHCKTRLDKVIDGEQGGISNEVNWHGGGGYRFYELADPLLVKSPVLPVHQINPKYTWAMVAEAVCKIEGFIYAPYGDFQGHSSEKRFIHVTREFVNSRYITSVMKPLGEDQALLIYCIKFQARMRLPENVEIKRIPKDLLDRCNFGAESEVEE